MRGEQHPLFVAERGGVVGTCVWGHMEASCVQVTLLGKLPVVEVTSAHSVEENVRNEDWGRVHAIVGQRLW